MTATKTEQSRYKRCQLISWRETFFGETSRGETIAVSKSYKTLALDLCARGGLSLRARHLQRAGLAVAVAALQPFKIIHARTFDAPVAQATLELHAVHQEAGLSWCVPRDDRGGQSSQGSYHERSRNQAL